MIRENLNTVRVQLPPGVQLVAVSKFHPSECVMEAYDAGQRVFGESHVQELVAKERELPKDIRWHFIGHLQTNKVKYIAPFIELVHAVDTLKLLREIHKQALRAGRTIDCLLELRVAQEESKYGFAPDALFAMLRDGEWRTLTGARLCGLMCMATLTDDTRQIHGEFRQARQTFDAVKAEFFANDDTFRTLSMGMSNDYGVAIDEGATLVRVGTKIFGTRNY